MAAPTNTPVQGVLGPILGTTASPRANPALQQTGPLSSHSHSPSSSSHSLPINPLPLSTLPTPVQPSRLQALLAGYDLEITNYLIQGFSTGFKLGFQGPLPGMCMTNLPSALQRPAVVDSKLESELSLGRISGPWTSPPFGGDTVTSPIGLVEKKSNPGSFRLIHHLSFPAGSSINDGIPLACSRVTYASVDDAITMILRLGKGCYLAKTDIQSAFRIVPVHPSDYHLLGFQWGSPARWFYHRVLPFEASSSPKIFETFSSALEWVAKNRLAIEEIAHILDDFLFGAYSQAACNAHLTHFLHLCQYLGVPIAGDKTFSAAQRLVFSGLLFDTNTQVIMLPEDKLLKCRQAIHQIQGRRSITLRDLQSVLGYLQFCTRAIVPGRAFLRRLYNLTIGISRPHHHISLNAGARADLAAWDFFLTHFNGRVLMLPSAWETSTSLSLATDSSKLGYGAVFGTSWFYGQWPASWSTQHITLLELYPIVASLHAWAHTLRNKRILFFTDNLALVHIINQTSSRDPKIMVLLRRLVIIAMQFNIHFRSKWLPGCTNVLPDLLSRLQVQHFRDLAPWAEPHPTVLSPDISPMTFCLA